MSQPPPPKNKPVATPATIPTQTEVFRITPIPDKLYETALYTRKTGEWPNEKYFTTFTPRFVGKFIKHCQIGQGDGAIHYDIFEKEGRKIRIDYTYEGTTCYREYNPLEETGVSVFAINPDISRTSTPDPDLFDLSCSSGPYKKNSLQVIPKPSCCIIT